MRYPVRIFPILLALTVVAACTPMQYRDVQDDFHAAVAGDNVQTFETVGALTTNDSERRYAEIEARLTDDEIARLDQRLRPNAHAIRAVSQWRSGKLVEARETALAGQALPNVAQSPRDHLVLLMIPALVIDEQLVARYRNAGETVTEADYTGSYAANFATAAEVLQKAGQSVQASTPESVIYYVHLQRWRVLQNWFVVISGIDRGGSESPAAVRRALTDARQRLGVELAAAMTAEEKTIPDGHPLRQTMTAIRQR
ncbi:MAG TPA: hypothetical protein VEL28_11850 [Candidatus Binatia bacterium]|nr:hypothetical protein [Candidatus Binatia bacterium]